MSHLLVFGATSLVGSHFVAQTRHSIDAVGRRDPRELGLRVERYGSVDLRVRERIEEEVRRSPAIAVVNFSGFTEVDAAEKERRATGTAPGGGAFEINALAPESMAKAARATGKRLIHLSTDFVFDGAHGPYAETARPAPLSELVSWYGWTKGEGERRVASAHPDAAVVRIAYPYRAHWEAKSDFARNWLARFRAGTVPSLFTDQRFTPTWIPDVSRVIEHLLATGGRGVYHAASPVVTSPHELGSELAALSAGHPVDVPPGSMREFLRRPGATPRPVQGGLTSRRLTDEGVPLTDWRTGIRHLLAGKEDS